MSEYIAGLEKAMELLDHSSEADEMEMRCLPLNLRGAKQATQHAKDLIMDEIKMTNAEFLKCT